MEITPKIIEKDGKRYLVIGDKAIPFERFDEAGNPIIDVKSEVIKHPDGRQDVIIKVPCLQIKVVDKKSKQ